MRLSPWCPAAIGLAGLLVSMGASVGQAGGPAKLALAKASPPTELHESIRSALQDTVIRLSEDGQPFFEIWLRREVPLAAEPSTGAVPMTAVKEGTLLGALKVHRERFDFKDEEIPPGVYVMRLGLQPQDGDHLGTSPTRTFALLTPAKADRKLQGLSDHDQLVKASSTINAAEHPSNLSLQPVREPPDVFPALASHARGEHKVVCLRLPARAGSQKEPAVLTFALVYEGMGEF